MTRRGKPNVTVRMDPGLWERFGTVTEDRSSAVREMIAWYVRDPGAKLPKRPDSIPRTDDSDQASDPGPSPM